MMPQTSLPATVLSVCALSLTPFLSAQETAALEGACDLTSGLCVFVQTDLAPDGTEVSIGDTVLYELS